MEPIPQQLILSPAEREALPDKVRQYISTLETMIESHGQTLVATKDELRRKRFAYWNNSK